MMGRARIALFSLLTLSVASPAFSSVLGVAAGYNAFVFGNFTESNTDSAGALAVGGNATLSSYTVATNGSTGTNLVVGGTLTNTGGTVNGDAIVAGTADYTTPTITGKLTATTVNLHNSGGSVTGGVFYTGTYTGPSFITHTSITGPVSLPVDFAGTKTSLVSKSQGLAALTTNGTTVDTSNNVTFTGTSSGTNVFSITASQLASASIINVSVPTGGVSLINVTGATSDTMPNVSYNLTPTATLWNFNGVTSLTLTGSANGSILAPNAAVSTSFGELFGTLVGNSLTGNLELHSAPFPTDIPTGSPPPSPEPASLSVLGLGAVMLLKRRRKA